MSTSLLKRLVLFAFFAVSFLCLLIMYIRCYFYLNISDIVPFLSNFCILPGKCLSLVGTSSDRVNDTYILNSDLCKNNTKLLILVFSAPQNFISRKAIRNTWGSTKIHPISFGFLFGRVKSPALQQDIREEYEANGDIIQDGSFLDDYYNLTAKAISMLRWATLYCKGAEGVFRGADDIWLNQEKALELLISNYRKEGIYGFIIRQPWPLENNNRWSMPKTRYNKTYLPYYVQGHSFLVIRGKERNVFELMVNASKFVDFIQIEDIDITGYMADALEIKRFHTVDFHIEKVLPLNKITYEKLITSHHVSDAEKCFLWNKMNCKQKKPRNIIKQLEAQTQRRSRRESLDSRAKQNKLKLS